MRSDDLTPREAILFAIVIGVCIAACVAILALSSGGRYVW